MKYWWENHTVYNRRTYTKEQVGYFTGHIPLLLANCVDQKKEIHLMRLKTVLHDQISEFVRENRDHYRNEK